MRVYEDAAGRASRRRAIVAVGVVLIALNAVLAGLYCFRIIGNPY